PGERTEQMDRTALVIAEVACFDACLGDFLCWRVPNGSALDAPDNPLAPNMRDGWQLAESEQAALDDARKLLGPLKDVGRFIFVERGEDGGTGQRVGTPGIGALAIMHVGEQIGPPDGRAHGNAVAESLAKHHDIRLDAVLGKGK